MPGSHGSGPEAQGEAEAAPGADGGAHRLTRNAASSAARYLIPALLGLLVAPYALRVLGADRFGLWAIAGVVLTLSRVLDLGLQRSLVRAVSWAYGRGSPVVARPALATGLGAMRLLGAAYVLLVLAGSGPVLERVLQLPPELMGEGRYVLVGTAVVAAAEAWFMPWQATLDGVGRMDLSSLVDALQRSLSAIGVVLVLSLGWGLEGLVWKNLALIVVAGFAYRWLSAREAPELASVRARLSVPVLRTLLAFGRHVQMVNVSMLIIDVGSKLLVGRSLGMAVVASLELALRIVNQIGGGLLAAASAVFPAAAGAFATGDRARTPGRGATASVPSVALLRLYSRSTRALAWFTLPVYCIVIVLSEPFTIAWLGPGHRDVAVSIAILSAGYLVGVLAAPAHMVAQATERQRASTMAAGASVLVALLGAVALLPTLGLTGVVLGVSAGIAVGGLVVWALLGSGLGLGLRIVTCIGPVGPIGAIVAAVIARTVAGSLPTTLLGVTVAGCAGLAGHVCVLAAGGAVAGEERDAVRAVVARLRAGTVE